MKSIKQYWRIAALGFLGWTLFGVFFALQSYGNSSYFGQPVSLTITLVIWLICGYSWGLLTPLVIYLSRRFFIERGQIGRNLLIHLLVSPFVAMLHLTLFILGRQMLVSGPQTPLNFWDAFQRMFVISFHADLVVYWVLLGIFHLYKTNLRYLEREREAARFALETSQLETRLAQAQLDALKMQLHPHFLFNTLNSISVLMRSNVKIANQMLVRLSELLRAALKSGSSQEISLKDELEFLRGYLEIEQTRFQDRLTVTFEIQNETLDARVPNLILQPLVENAIRHGIEPADGETGLIHIQAKRENGFIELSVGDNGAGLKDSSKGSTGIGLKNTRERLEKLYGEEQKFEIISAENAGLQVRIKIPYHKNEK